MKRLVIDARESGTSSGRYIDKLIEHLHPLDPDYDVIVLTKEKRLDYVKKIAPNFTVMDCPHKEFTFDEQIGLKKQIRALKPDLVHFAFAQQPVWYRGKTITTVHDLTTVRFTNPSKNLVVFKAKQFVYKYVIRRAVHKATSVITPTEYVKKDLADFAHINPDKITVTLESADPMPGPSQPFPGLEGQAFIMYLGRPMPHKNLRRLIDAFVLLKQSRPELKLVLAGKQDAVYAEHVAYVQQNNIKDVVFTDFIADEQLRWLYENCAAYVFPSLSEGFGLPPLEAMIHGAPIVASNATCIPEVCGEAAHYFDPLDIQAMADAINEVLTDKALRQALIEKGRQQVAKFSWTRMAQQTLELYQKALQ